MSKYLRKTQLQTNRRDVNLKRPKRKIDIEIERLIEDGSLAGTALGETLEHCGNDFSEMLYTERIARGMIEYRLNNDFHGIYRDGYPREVDELIDIILRVEYSEEDQYRYHHWIC